MKNGLLLINIGTPAKATSSAVRQFLREFLLDKRVITLPAILRYLLVYGLILPFRTKNSTHAYQKIWQKNGSPLLVISEELVENLQRQLGLEWKVALGMRYGNPSIESALHQLDSCNNLVILPLYPQYASSSTGSSIERTLQLISKKNIQPSFFLIRDFFQQPWFINAQTELIKPHLLTHDFFLFSYHGIPNKHLAAVGCINPCQTTCSPMQDKACYRAQCQQTTYLLANRLKLSPDKFAFTFQSRLGKTPWIGPYTEEYLPELAKKGLKRLAVCCPSFTIDCLETLEEIGIRARDQWSALGGEKFTLIPCVNTSDLWVQGIVSIANSPFCAIEDRC